MPAWLIYSLSSGLDLALTFIEFYCYRLTFDTQKIINNYDYNADNASLREMSAIYGALALYLDFINLFLYLLRFMGDRRN
jgi:FtsH-binding integral membrane protein